MRYSKTSDYLVRKTSKQYLYEKEIVKRNRFTNNWEMITIDDQDPFYAWHRFRKAIVLHTPNSLLRALTVLIMAPYMLWGLFIFGITLISLFATPTALFNQLITDATALLWNPLMLTLQASTFHSTSNGWLWLLLISFWFIILKVLLKGIQLVKKRKLYQQLVTGQAYIVAIGSRRVFYDRDHHAYELTHHPLKWWHS